MISLGAPAPEFKLVDTNRAPKTLKDFAGKKTVLAFYPGAFTGVCTKEMCAFQDSMARLNGLDANVVGISVDGPFANAEFAQRNRLEFPLLSDYDRSAVKAYGLEIKDFAGMPGYTAAQRAVFVLDREGVVRYSWIAENPGLEPDYEAVIGEVEKLS